MDYHRKETVECPGCGRDLQLAPSRVGKIKFHNAECRTQASIDKRTDRFLSFVDTSAGPEACWPWKGHRKNGGYGAFSIGTGKNRSDYLYAHRYAYELTYGPLPEGAHVLHRCDNPPCCNPSHLFVGDQYLNNEDRDLKDRVRHGAQHPNAKLTEDQVRRIRELSNALTQRELGQLFGVSQKTIGDLLRGITWRRT